jgi:glycosyltransferase involved in cell wall biosynthesis
MPTELTLSDPAALARTLAEPRPAGASPLLTIVMPAYNEAETIREIVAAVLAVPIASRELVIVDDGSKDGTRDILSNEIAKLDGVRVILHEKNQGKGAALRTGFREARGDYVCVQDADMEYDPREIPRLLEPLILDLADVVYGSRFLGGPHRVLYYWHSVGNQLLTTASNIVTDLNLTDMETCYKAFRRSVIAQVDIQEDRFGFEPEVTAKVARLGARVYEVPISYRGRTYAQGKKIGLKDAFRALYCIGKYGVLRR